MRELNPRLELDPEAPVERSSVRLTVVQEDTAHPLLDTTGDDWLNTVPHLVLRELTAVCLLIAFFALVSYFFDAPLLDLANPSVTPNPAKAPWYFLGLQELLHYYPPFVSGVVMPGLVVLALLIVPYFDVNIDREPFLSGRQFHRHLLAFWIAGTLALLVFFFSSHAGPVWPLIGVTIGVLVTLSLPLVLGRERGVGAWIATRSLPFWVFTWFVLAVVVLTVIGTFFRGPGWSFTLPWVSGIYD